MLQVQAISKTVSMAQQKKTAKKTVKTPKTNSSKRGRGRPAKPGTKEDVPNRKIISLKNDVSSFPEDDGKALPPPDPKLMEVVKQYESALAAANAADVAVDPPTRRAKKLTVLNETTVFYDRFPSDRTIDYNKVIRTKGKKRPTIFRPKPLQKLLPKRKATDELEDIPRAKAAKKIDGASVNSALMTPPPSESDSPTSTSTNDGVRRSTRKKQISGKLQESKSDVTPAGNTSSMTSTIEDTSHESSSTLPEPSTPKKPGPKAKLYLTPPQSKEERKSRMLLLEYYLGFHDSDMGRVGMPAEQSDFIERLESEEDPGMRTVVPDSGALLRAGVPLQRREEMKKVEDESQKKDNESYMRTKLFAME